HDLCVLNDVNARVKSKSVMQNIKKKFRNQQERCSPILDTLGDLLTHLNSVVTLVYSWKPKKSKSTDPVSKSKVVQIVLWYLDSGCSKHMTEDRSQLTNCVNKFLEGLGHNLFSVGQFCDSNLEVAFRQHTCFIRNLDGVDLLTGSRGNNLYTLSLGDMISSSPICLLSKASKTKSWLWHRRLSHLNFGAINHLARHGLVREQALLCYYNAFLTAIEPKTYKDDLIQSCWIEAMQEELNEFERLGVWELVARPDKVMVITLKWIYKVKLDELGDNLNHVYKLKKALFGLKQAPRAWYDMLSSFLISQDFSKGSVDPTMFIRKDSKELLQMSMMGKILFFSGLHISQSPRGIYINQPKYALESLKKYGFDSCDPMNTPIVEKSKLNEDKQGKTIDPLYYRSAYRKALTCGQKDLSVSTRNHKSGTMVSEGFFDCSNNICRCGSCWSKHIDIKYHFIKELIENRVIKLYFVNTKYQLADIFTKALGRERIEFLINKLRMRSFMPETLKQLADEVEE
nr:retrotransposon protein, putative, unclassified [Tanacetum cinerariifolium]